MIYLLNTIVKKGAQKQTHKIIEDIKTHWAWNIEDETKIFQDFKVIFLNYGADDNKDDFKVENRIRLELLTFLDPFPIVEKKDFTIYNEIFK